MKSEADRAWAIESNKKRGSVAFESSIIQEQRKLQIYGPKSRIFAEQSPFGYRGFNQYRNRKLRIN